MANYAKMTSKKLTALLTSVSEDEAAEIQAILDARGNTASDETASDETATNEAEDKFLQGIAEAEEAAAAAGTASISKGQKIGKMSYEDAQELAKTLEDKVNHRCKVVPFNTIEWAEGTVVGVVADKRSCKVLYAIRCDDGRRILKAHDSKMIIILNEIAEKAAGTRRSKGSSEDKLEEAALLKLAAELSVNVGHYATFAPTRDYYVVREEDQAIVEVTELTGTIMAIVPDKRSGRILYRIQCEFMAYDENGQDTEAGPATKLEKVTVHKVSVSEDLKILDEVNAEVRERYEARAANRLVDSTMTPIQKIEAIKNALAKNHLQLTKLQENSRLLNQQLQDAELALEQQMANEAADEKAEITE